MDDGMRPSWHCQPVRVSTLPADQAAGPLENGRISLEDWDGKAISMANAPSRQLVRSLDQLDQHEHACLLYGSSDEQFAVLAPFMQLGLRRGERCLYVADDNTPDAVIAGFSRYGVELDAAIGSGQFLLLTKRQAYLKDGAFRPEDMLALLERAAAEAVAAGYAGVRGSGEMTWALDGSPGNDRLMEYESKLNHLLDLHQILAICQYNRRRFSPEMLVQAIRTHPILIQGGVVSRNFYYEPPEEFLGTADSGKELDRLLRNIRERSRAEQALRESHDRYQAMVAAVTSYRYTVQIARGVVTSTQHGPGCLAVTGYGPDDYASDPVLWLNMICPEDREKVLRHIAAAMEGEHAAAIEHRIHHRSGRTRWVRSTLVPHRDRTGRIIAYDGLVEDITARKEAEISLQNARDELERRVSERTAELARRNEQLRQEIAERRRAESALTERLKELTCLYELSHLVEDEGLDLDQFLERAANIVPRALRHVELACARITVEGRHHATTGFQTSRWRHAVPVFVGSEPAGHVEVCYLEPGPGDSTAPFRLEECNLIRAIAERIGHVVERRRATESLKVSQERLHQTERLASLGTLSAGIAHEINNPIGMMLLAAQTAMKLKDSPGSEDALSRSLDLIVENARRCSEIVTSLLQFARQEPTKKWPSDLNEIVKRAIRLSQLHMVDEKVIIQADLAGDLPRVIMNPIEMEQVLINLIRNAADSGQDGVHVQVQTTRTADGVQLVVRDDGQGMPQEQCARIFDPFYTTRQDSGGTGLGLSIVHGLVSQHGGTIRVESQPSKGSAFIITLPGEPQALPEIPKNQSVAC